MKIIEGSAIYNTNFRIYGKPVSIVDYKKQYRKYMLQSKFILLDKSSYTDDHLSVLVLTGEI
jgi:hypothetical protein